jgi:uncharacterized protein YigA (DUF484 family)
MSNSKAKRNHKLVEMITRCHNARQLGKILQENEALFDSRGAITAFVKKISALKQNMTKYDILGLLNKLSNAQVPVKAERVHRDVMITMGKGAIAKVDCFEAKDISLTLNAFARRNIQNDEVFKWLGEAALLIIGKFNAQSLAILVNAFAKLNYRNSKLFDEVAQAALAIIHTFDAKNLANTVNAFAKLDYQYLELFDAIARATLPMIHKFNAHDLANIVNAFAKMEHRNDRLFCKIAKASLPMIHRFNAQDLANTANAFAKMGHRNKFFFDKIAKAALPMIHGFNAQDLTITVNAFAKLEYQHSDLFDEIAQAALPMIHRFNAQNLINTVSAFAKMGHQNNRLFDKIAKVILPMIHSFNAQDLANTADAFAKMGHRNSKLFDKISKSAHSMIHRFSAQDLVNIVGAIARIQVVGQSSQKLFWAISYLVTDDSTSLSKYSNQYLVQLAYAYMNAGQRAKPLLDKIGKELASRGAQSPFNARELGTLAAAFSKCKTASSENVLEMAFKQFQNLDATASDLQAVVDISNALLMGETLRVIPSGFVKDIVNLAIDKSGESRPIDVKDILLNVAKIDLDQQLWNKLLVTYKPIFDDLSPRFSAKRRARLEKIFS